MRQQAGEMRTLLRALCGSIVEAPKPNIFQKRYLWNFQKYVLLKEIDVAELGKI